MIFLIIVPCVLCFVYAWRRRRKYLEGKLPPEAVYVWPIVGHLHLWIRASFWGRLLEIQKDSLKKGGITYFYSGTNASYTYYGISDPEDSMKVATLSDQKLLFLDDSIKGIFGEGLATAPVWTNHRQLLEHLFEQLCYMDVLNREAKELVARFDEKSGKGPFDPKTLLQYSTLHILFTIILGVTEETSCITPGKIEEYGSSLQNVSSTLFERYRSLFMHSKLLFNCSRLKYKQNEFTNIMKTICNEIITVRMAEIVPADETFNKDTEATKCLLDGLLKLHSQGLYSEEQVADEVNTMMFSGFETIANSLTFILVMIGSHPVVQEKVYNEIINVIDPTKFDINLEHLSKLLYLDAVVKETLRLYPVVPTVSRALTAPVEIKNYSLEPGSQCLLFIYAMNRHLSWGQNRESFRPERWLDGRSPCHGFATFGMGARSCIGMKMALDMMKIILVHLLKDYKITADHTKMVVDHRLLLTPTSGTSIALEKR